MKPKIILTFSVVLFVIAFFAVSQLEVVSNMEEMMPADSPSMLASKEFNQYFTGQDQVYVVVAIKDAVKDQDAFHATAQEYLDTLASAIKDMQYIDSLMYKINREDLESYQWAYMDDEVYEELDHAVESNELSFVLRVLENVQTESIDHEPSKYLMNEQGTHYIMLIKPQINTQEFMKSRSVFYEGVYEQMDLALARVNDDYISVGLSGGAFLQDIEADTMAFDGLFSTLLVTLLLIIVVIVVFLRSVKLPMLSIFPLMLSTTIAAACAYLIYGSINMFAVSFALLLLGLGIDYAVHLIVRYYEERSGMASVEKSVKRATKTAGSSILIGAVTTAIAFASFSLARFKAFEQIGVISATGILAACAAMLIIMPALIRLSEQKQQKNQIQSLKMGWIEKMATLSMEHPITVLTILLIAGLVFISPVRSTSVQSDISAIYPDNIPSVQWAEIMKEAFDHDTNTLTIYADDIDELQYITQQLESREDVWRVESILEFIPRNQEEKLQTVRNTHDMLSQAGIEVLADMHLEPIGVDDLPDSIRSNYVGLDGKLRAEILPAFNIYDYEPYDQLLQAILEITGRYPVGMSVIMNEVTAMVREDILSISLICIGVILILTWIMLKKLRYAMIAVFNLILTLYITIGLSNSMGIELNVFSIAAFPLIIGIGIDSGIHLIHRLLAKESITPQKRIMHTGRAVLLTALTTMIGFGSLSMINHPGMANLGMIVALGIGISCILTLVFVPVAYVLMERIALRRSSRIADIQEVSEMESGYESDV